MRKIIIVFSVLVIVFAIVIVSAKIYGMIKENNGNNDNPTVLLNKPTISVSTIESLCQIEIQYDEGLDKVAYWWNEETINEKNMNAYTEPFIATTQIPEGGNNVLHVKATGIDGSVNEKVYEYIDEDLNKPKISWYYDEENVKIDIIATSDKGIENLTYMWEGEESITINATEENQEELKVTIEPKRGTHKLLVTATDIEGNLQTKEDNIIAVHKPEIKVVLENGKTLKINITHDVGFKKASIKINDKEFIYDENDANYSSETKELVMKMDVPTGTLSVDIRVYTLEQEDKEYTFIDSIEI